MDKSGVGMGFQAIHIVVRGLFIILCTYCGYLFANENDVDADKGIGVVGTTNDCRSLVVSVEVEKTE